MHQPGVIDEAGGAQRRRQQAPCLAQRPLGHGQRRDHDEQQHRPEAHRHGGGPALRAQAHRHDEGGVDKAGGEICLSVQQADMISVSAGVVTVLNYAGWVVWGNYTGCYPASSDVAKVFICCNRMQDFLCNTFTTSYWSYIDKPLSRVIIDAIVNSFNSYLNGLIHDGKLYGGEVRYVPDNNPTANLLAGKIRLDLEMASPVPAQQVDMHETFNVDLMTVALAA